MRPHEIVASVEPERWGAILATVHEHSHELWHDLVSLKAPVSYEVTGTNETGITPERSAGLGITAVPAAAELWSDGPYRSLILNGAALQSGNDQQRQHKLLHSSPSSFFYLAASLSQYRAESQDGCDEPALPRDDSSVASDKGLSA